MDIVPEKKCLDCPAPKPVSEFHRAGNGYQPLCKEHSKARHKEWVEKNRERLRVYGAANAQRRRPARAASREKNRETRRAYGREHYHNARERELARNKVYRSENHDLLEQKRRERYRANPTPKLESNRNRRSLRKGGEGTFTEAEFQVKLAQYQGKCHWCGKKIQGIVHRDHLIPLVPKDDGQPGSNDISNIVPTCALCNSTKRNLAPWEFMEGRLL